MRKLKNIMKKETGQALFVKLFKKKGEKLGKTMTERKGMKKLVEMMIEKKGNTKLGESMTESKDHNKAVDTMIEKKGNTKLGENMMEEKGNNKVEDTMVEKKNNKQLGGMKMDKKMKTMMMGACVAAGLVALTNGPIFAEESADSALKLEYVQEEVSVEDTENQVKVDEEAAASTDAENSHATLMTALTESNSSVSEELPVLTEEEMMSIFEKYIGTENWKDEYTQMFCSYFSDNLTEDDFKTVTVGGVTYQTVADESQFQEQIAAVISFVRELNGLSPVQSIDEYNYYAQAGMDYLAQNNLEISHLAAYGVAGAEDADEGLEGSCIAQQTYTSDVMRIYNSDLMRLLMGFFGDDDSHNRLGLGHRYWMLDPTLEKIGVGYVKQANGTAQIAIYVCTSREETYAKKTIQYTFPNSGVTSVEMLEESFCSISMPWSVVMGSDYDYYLDDHYDEIFENMKITITDENGKVYTIDTSVYDVDSIMFKDWFAFDEAGYGWQHGALKISFNPISLYKDYNFNKNGNSTGYKGLCGHSFTVKIEGLPDEVEYTVNFVSMIDTVKEAKAAKEVIQNVENLIEQINATITISDKAAIEAASEAYNALTDAQKALVDSDMVAKLNNAVAAYETIVKEAELANKAANVINKINALPENVTMENAEAVKKAKQAYDALDAETKTYLQGKSQYTKLTGANQTLLNICSNALTNVNNLIDALPATISLKDKTAIENARIAYNALPTYDVDYKTLVSSERASKLGNAESTIVNLENEATDKAAAKAVDDLIKALPAKDDIALSDEDAIKNAKTAYNTLTEAQKSYVTNLSTLTDAELKIENLKAQQKADDDAAKEVSALIEALPNTPALSDKEKIDNTYTKYTAMTNAQKLLVSMENYNKLVSAKSTVDALYDAYLVDKTNADTVMAQINALPTIVTVDSETAIKNARSAYDALKDSAKSMVTQDRITKLTDAENALAVAKKVESDRSAAQKVVDLITALPEDLQSSDAKAVLSARQAYDTLTADQKLYVNSETLTKLTQAEQSIAEALKIAADQAEAAKIVEKIEGLPTSITAKDLETVQAVKDAYDALTEEQKTYVDAEAKKRLDASVDAVHQAVQKVIDDIKAATEVENTIYALPGQDSMTYADCTAVYSAQVAYDSLTDDQKGYVAKQAKDYMAGLLQKAGQLVEKHTEDMNKANEVKTLIEALPANIALNDENAVNAAKDAYEGLTPDQKEFVEDTVVKKLSDSLLNLQTLKTQAAAAAVILKIDSLPQSIAYTDEAAVLDAVNAYDALDEAAKVLIGADKKQDLEDAVKALDAAKEDHTNALAAKVVADSIRSLPTEVTLKDKKRIVLAMKGYSNLTPAQKLYISAEDLNKLNGSMAMIHQAEADEVAELYKDIPEPDQLQADDATFLAGLRGSYEALSEEAKAVFNQDSLTKLEAAEKIVKALKQEAADRESAGQVADLIDILKAPKDLSLSDSNTVYSVYQTYKEMTPGAAALLDEERIVKVRNCYDRMNALVEAEKIRQATTEDISVHAINGVNAPKTGLNDADSAGMFAALFGMVGVGAAGGFLKKRRQGKR